MLHRLPNEILLKILEKTKSKTVKECRLLNSQFDSLIQRFQLHLRNIDVIHVAKYPNVEGYRFGLTREKEYPRDIKCNTYEQMLSRLVIHIETVRSVKKLEFRGITIDEDLIRVFINQRWLRKLDKLEVRDCHSVGNTEPFWFSFLSKLRLESLTILYIENEPPSMDSSLPPTILNNVRSFEFVSWKSSLVEIPWMKDNVLENYLAEGKTVDVYKAYNSFTLEGVKLFLKNISKSGRSIKLKAGIMKNVTTNDMDKLLKELKAEYELIDRPKNEYIIYWVDTLGAKQEIVMAACRNVPLA